MFATSSSTLPAPSRSHGLDTLRALAIILVFAYHYRVFVSGEATFGWASTVGWVGVDLFFVLSGYLIANQLFAGIAKGREPSWQSFYARRMLRTLPNYYVVLALYFLFPAVMGGKTPPALWRFLSFTQNLGLQPGTAFSHAWSLCIEEQFYLVLPIALLLALRVRRSIAWAWATIALFIVAAMGLRSALWLQYGREATGAIDGYYPNIYYATLCRFDEFLPGVAIALAQNFHPQSWARLMAWGRALFALGIAATLVVLFLVLRFYSIDGYGYGYFMTGFGYSLVAGAFGLLVLAALSPQSPLSRFRVPGAAPLAAWSYAIYLTHKPLAVIARNLLAPWGLPAGLGVLLIMLVCLLGGWLLYRLVERPFMALRDRYVPSSFSARLRLSLTPTRFS